jgi:N-acetylmuramoyl-L-alanine amidase
VSFGNKFSEIGSVELKDSKTMESETYYPVSLLLKGKDVVTDIPGILYVLDGESRTLVPVRFIIEELGASVLWAQETKTVTIDYNGKIIKLVIDDEYATVDGEKVKLPSGVSAKLMAYEDSWRTMVPIRFISENFDLDVDWIEDTKTVSINSSEQNIVGIDFKYKIKFPEIRIKTTGYVDINDYSVGGGDFGIDNKMIFSIPNTNLLIDEFDEEDIFLTKENNMIKYDIYISDDVGIHELKMDQALGDIKSTTIEIDLDKKKGFNTFYDYKTNEIVIQLINSVEDIYIDDIYNAKTLIVETKEDIPAYNPTVNRIDNLVTIDVVNSNLMLNEGQEKTVQVNEGGILNYTYFQLDTSNDTTFESDDIVTRIIMKLDNSKSVDDVYIEENNNKIFAYVSGNPLDGFEYVKVNNAVSNLSINFLEKGIYNIDIDENSNVVELSFLKDLVDIDNMNLDIDDQIIEKISISKNFDKYFIRFKLEDSVQIKKNTIDNVLTDNILIEFKNYNIVNSEYSDKLIVIDPGHGGKDPGAIGTITRTTESDLVLKTSFMLKKQLEAKGFKVYLTRDKDEYVDLYQRPNIANKLNADLFVSIHINAFSNPKAEGIEVLYADDDKRDSYSFAKIVQGKLITYLNRVDRGVKNRPRLVVLKNTEMPAILTELGFLTNKIEEEMLCSDMYLEKAADAIYNGIIDQLN